MSTNNTNSTDISDTGINLLDYKISELQEVMKFKKFEIALQTEENQTVTEAEMLLHEILSVNIEAMEDYIELLKEGKGKAYLDGHLVDYLYIEYIKLYKKYISKQ